MLRLNDRIAIILCRGISPKSGPEIEKKKYATRLERNIKRPITFFPTLSRIACAKNTASMTPESISSWLQGESRGMSLGKKGTKGGPICHLSLFTLDTGKRKKQYRKAGENYRCG